MKLTITAAAIAGALMLATAPQAAQAGSHHSLCPTHWLKHAHYHHHHAEKAVVKKKVVKVAKKPAKKVVKKAPAKKPLK